MAKITLTEAVYVSTTLDGKAVELDLVAGENEVDEKVAETLGALGLLVSDSTPKTSTSKKTSSAPVVEEIPTTESSEAN